MTDSAHKAVVQQEFTRQADAYAVAPTVSDPERIARLVQAVGPASDARVLDVACGLGFLALAFATHLRKSELRLFEGLPSKAGFHALNYFADIAFREHGIDAHLLRNGGQLLIEVHRA